MYPTPMPTPEKSPLLSPKDVALRLRISRAMAYKLLTTRALPYVRIGRSVRVREADLEAFIQKCANLD